MDFGDKIKRLREQKNLSQDALADSVGVSLRTIRNWESGRVPRKIEHYTALAKALDCDVTYLMDGPKKQVENLMNDITTLFAGGEIDEEDMDTLMLAIQAAYVKAKMERKQN